MKHFFFILLSMAVFASCKKSEVGGSRILIYNATYSTTALTAALNGTAITATALSQGQVSGLPDAPYQKFPAGTNNIIIKSGTNILADKNLYTSASGGYSILVYDTGLVAGLRNILVLTDDLTPPDTATIHLRILNCVPDTLAADIWMVNANGIDSFELAANSAFLGKAATASSVQAFGAIKYHGETYTAKVKKTGTEEVIAVVSNYLFKEREIYSFVYSGLPLGIGNTARKLVIVHHQLN